MASVQTKHTKRTGDTNVRSVPSEARHNQRHSNVRAGKMQERKATRGRPDQTTTQATTYTAQATTYTEALTKKATYTGDFKTEPRNRLHRIPAPDTGTAGNCAATGNSEDTDHANTKGPKLHDRYLLR